MLWMMMSAMLFLVVFFSITARSRNKEKKDRLPKHDE